MDVIPSCTIMHMIHSAELAGSKKWHTLNRPPYWPRLGQIMPKSNKGLCIIPSWKCPTARSWKGVDFLESLWSSFTMLLLLVVLHWNLRGDLKNNNVAIGLAVKHCGVRPCLAMFEQAAHQFFSLALPRGKAFCSIWVWWIGIVLYVLCEVELESRPALIMHALNCS